jgi:hypothetical protein
MTDVRAGDLRISGTLTAGNYAQGDVTITTVANTPTSTTVTGLNLQGAGSIHGWVTPNTTVPGLRVIETSISDLASTGMTVWIYRTTVFDTIVRWLMARQRE